MAEAAKAAEAAESTAAGTTDDDQGGKPQLVVEAAGGGKPSFDIVAVHGIQGNRRSPWEEDGDSPRSLWLSDCFGEDAKVMTFHYDTGADTETCYTRRAINKQARTLLEGLMLQRRDMAKARPIVFVSQDIGGLIVKAALVLATREPSEFSKVVTATTGLVFFGYPHRSVGFNALEERVSLLLALRDGAYPQGYAHRLASSLSETIIEVNDAFLHTAVVPRVHLVSVYSSHSDQSKRIFDKASAMMGVPLEVRVETEQAHSALTKASTRGPSVLKKSHNQDWKLNDFAPHQAPVFEKLHALASPIYPPLIINETALEPPANDFLDDFLATGSNRLLHIQHSIETAAVAESVFNYIYTKKVDGESVLYFPFQSHDIRFNGIDRMLWTFLVQAAYCEHQSRRWCVKQCLGNIKELHSWTREDLYAYFEEFHLFRQGARYMFVLGQVDQCDQSFEWFLAKLKFRFAMTDMRLRIVITTTAGSDADRRIKALLTETPLEEYRCLQVPRGPDGPGLGNRSAEAGFSLSMLLQGHPWLCDSGLEDKIRDILASCGNERQLCEVVLNWLRWSSAQHEVLEQGLAKLVAGPLTPGLVCEAILTSIPKRHHDEARRLLSWVISSVRPLQVGEFCRVAELIMASGPSKGQEAAAKLSSGSQRQQAAEILKHHLGCLLHIENGEVVFSHPLLRGWLASDSAKSESEPERWYNTCRDECQRHLDILKNCVEHLDSVDYDDAQKRELLLQRLPYATRWATHYKLARGTEREASAPAEHAVSSLFRNQPALLHCISTYDTPSNMFISKPRREYETPLPVAAYFGLDEFVAAFNDKFSEERLSAMIEAARAGYLSVVRALLPSQETRYSLSDADLQNSVWTATTSGDGDILWEVVDRMLPKQDSHSGEKNIWLSDTLCRAAELGFDRVVTRIMDLKPMTDLPCGGYKNCLGPMNRAAHRNRTAAALALLAGSVGVGPGCSALGETPLHTAADFGSLDVAKVILRHGASVGAKTASNWTALQHACDWGQHEAADLILDQEPFEAYIDPDTSHPLIISIKKGNVKTVECLLHHAVDANVQDDSGTALYYAVESTMPYMCRMVLDKKADVNRTVGDSMPPLIKAVIVKKKEIIGLLLDHGADIERTEPSGFKRTALHVAVTIGDRDIVKYLLSRKANPNATDSEGWTVLWTAARCGFVEITDLLVEAGADTKQVCSDKEKTPLHVAHDSPDVVRILIAGGADVGKAARDGGTPLDAAIRANKADSVKVMLEEGNKKIDFTLLPFRDALSFAAKSGYVEIVRLLLEQGADVDQTDTWDNTLLGQAVRGEDEAMVRAVLEFRPDVHAKDQGGNTILHLVTEETLEASARLIVNAGVTLDALNAKRYTPLSAVVLANNLPVARYLLSKTAVIRSLDVAGCDGTALHIACRRSTSAIVELLVEKGADVNLPWEGMAGTPLMTACLRKEHGMDDRADKEKVVRYLLQKQADPKRSGGTLSFPIIAASLACSPDIIKLLLDAGAVMDVEDSMGAKPVHLACYNSLEALNALSVPDAHFASRDRVGRVPLHYAVRSGQLDLVEEVFRRSEAVGIGIDERDKDGWTPLHWAARVVNLWLQATRKEASEDIVRFLLNNGADTRIRGQGLYDSKNWSAREIALYHHADALADMLASRDTPHGSRGSRKRGGDLSGAYCDVCLLSVWGVCFQCTTCDDFLLCFKCYKSKDVVHPSHEFNARGYDYDSDDEEEEPAPNKEAPDARIGGADSDSGSLAGFDNEVVSDADGDDGDNSGGAAEGGGNSAEEQKPSTP